MEAISRPIRDAMDYLHVTTPELRALSVAAHSKIMEAIRAQDSASAIHRMKRHVEEYRNIAVSLPGEQALQQAT